MEVRSRQRLCHILRISTALAGLAAAGLTHTPAYAIVINDNYSPSDVVDTTNVTGIGQMVVDEQNGYIGLCTATLINPRTVIFASHCVNENPDGTAAEPGSGYGAATGGYPIGFGFQASNRQSIIDWFNSGYQTSTADRFYNANYVVYNTHSLDLGLGWNFLQSDIAMATLDTPAAGIPTWTLLFSPLSGPTHATIAGYGVNGTGTNGADGGIDFRRRVAENTISVLGSLDNQDTFLFGSPDGLPQNLYMMDFNDPKFGTAAASVYDFNIFRDAALQKEGITAPGDSGGPLIVDRLFSAPTIAAVLSGGDSFYYGQPGSSYGTTSFYQPLYLFWDWIIANNPYKYVSAKAGDGSWFDATHWVINLDPNYVTEVNGQLVNALPATPAEGTPASGDVNTPKFGNVCFYNDCVDIATGVETIYSSGGGGAYQVAMSALGSGAAPGNHASQPVSALAQFAAQFTTRGFTVQQQNSQNTPEGSAPAGGEVVQGAPGSSNFVPNDTDGNPSTGAPARYYDVTLSADGTTTLDNGTAIIDRLTVNGANTGLDIGPNGALGTLIDTTVYAGNFNVDGTYVSVGDIAMMGGVLSGSGVVVAPYTTAILGAIAPGSVGATGNLSVVGSVILSSGSGLLIDAGPTAIDRLDVYGTLSLGGTMVFTPVGGLVPRYGQSAVFATGDTISGNFDNVPDTLPGVLYPTVHFATIGSGGSAYQEALVQIDAATFASQLTAPTEDQLQVGDALDAARQTSYSALSALFDAVDPLSDNALGAGLENLAPDNARTLPLLNQLTAQSFSSFLWQRLGAIGFQAADGQTAFQLQTGALQLTQNSTIGTPQTRDLLAGLGRLGAVSGPGTDSVAVTPAQSDGAMALPKGMGGFLTGSSLDGSVAVGGGGGKAGLDGFIIAGGADLPAADGLRVGVSLSYSEISAALRSEPSRTDASTFQGAAYARYDAQDWFASAFAGGSTQTIDTRRDAVVGAATFHLAGRTDGNSPTAGIAVGKYLNLDGIHVAPAVGLQYLGTQIGGYSETGGAAAMTVQSYDTSEVDFRMGFDATGRIDTANFAIRPLLHAFVVDNVSGGSAPLTTSFTAAPGIPMTFALAPRGGLRGELGLGAEVDVGDSTALSVHYDTVLGRSDMHYGNWAGSLRIKF